MLLASSYPFLSVFWSILVIFGFFIWLMLLFTIFGDLFRRRDIGGWAKALWIVGLIILPYLGVLIYLIAEHNGMAERSAQQQQQAKSQFDDYVRTTAATAGPAGEIEKAKALLDSGAINQAEYERLKAKALTAA
jgi:ABC-type multidrug transport system fused ATPase/permease subunit